MAEPGYEVLDQYEHDIKTYTDAMRYKLKMNAHKGRWEDLDINTALKLLKKEVAELERAIKNGNVVEILLEGADVGNMALILTNIAITDRTQHD